MDRFFVLLTNIKSRPNFDQEIEKILSNNTSDWLRFSKGQYIVKYNGNAENLYSITSGLIDSDEYMLVVEADIKHRRGWASQLAVDWLGKHDQISE